MKRGLRGRNRRAAIWWAEIELLENRALLTANLAAGVLTVTGTEQADNIRLRVDGENLVVNEDGQQTNFLLADVTSIVVDGLGGDDRIKISQRVTIAATVNGGEGNDRIKGGAGDDTLNGDAGDDHIHGRRGNDTINGGEGNDYLKGECGDDIINGGEGDDRIRGSKGDDTISGDGGNDEIAGGCGKDNISGGDGDDKIGGGKGDDEVHGGADNDIVSGGPGVDNVLGEEGDDVVIGNSTKDTALDGGTGDDWIQDRAHLLDENASQQDIEARAAEIFAYLDGNNDQFLTQTEDNLTDHQWSRLKEKDTDHNDKISPTEFAAFVQAEIQDDGEGRGLLRFFGKKLSKWFG